jgi:hypothetical protein
MKHHAIGGVAAAALAALGLQPAAAAVATFESVSLPVSGYWNGSDLSGTAGPTGTFGETPYVQERNIEGLLFRNTYTTVFESWSGFAVSNHTDTTTAGFGNQYSAFAGSGAGGSAKYGIGYYATYEDSTHLKLGALTNLAGLGAYITNTTYVALDMLNGSGFSKKFGGVSGNDADWLKLTITGFSGGIPTGNAIDFYLADYRFANNAQDYVVSDWTLVDFTALGSADELRFTMSSSDNGTYGMNTPSFFAIDNVLAPVPEPSSALVSLLGLGLCLRRKR